jgi:hypothetical protein
VSEGVGMLAGGVEADHRAVPHMGQRPMLQRWRGLGWSKVGYVGLTIVRGHIVLRLMIWLRTSLCLY